MTSLLADMGGTNTRCAFADVDGTLHEIRAYRNADFGGPAELLQQYARSVGRERHFDQAVLAIAAPIRGDEVRMVNIDWRIASESLRDALGLERLKLLNDFEALALGLPLLSETDLLKVGEGTALPGGPKAALGPGTGLGVATLVPAGDHWQALSGEGGHVTLPAANERETMLIKRVRERFGHCSAERLISGPGLELLHATLHDTTPITAPEIARLADGGDAKAALSLSVLFDLLGTVAANLALTVGAFGGVYIGGGIVPRHAARFAASGFRERFQTKGRYGDYLRSIATFVIVSEFPTFAGLRVAARSLRERGEA